MRKAAALGLGVLLFCLYLFTAYPAVSPYRDSGDLATAAFSLGSAHPPGYPLYVLAGHVWLDLLRWGNPAYRMHVLSALFSALAAWLLFGTLERAGAGGVGGAASLLLLGLSPACWHLSVTSEMYSLNALFAAGLWALGCWPVASDPEPPAGAAAGGVASAARLRAAALLAGLGLANHQTLVLIAPALLWMWRSGLPERGDSDGTRGFLRILAPAVGLVLLGLFVYAYLPLRSRADPAVNWGEPGTPEMFWRLITRADLGSIRLHPERPAGLVDWSQWIAGLRIAGGMLLEQTGWTGALLAAWGLAASWRRRPAQGAFIAFALSGPFFIGWANLDPASSETLPILEPHLVLPLVFSAFLAGLGAADLRRRISVGAAARPGARPLIGLAAAAACLAGWAGSPGLRRAWTSLVGCRGDFSAWDFGRGLLDSLEPGAVVVDPDDVTAFSLSYFQNVRGERRDVRPVLFFRTRWGYRQLRRRHPELLPEWEPRSGQELYGAIIDKNLKAGVPVYVDLPQKTPPGTVSMGSGLAYRITPDVLAAAGRGPGSALPREAAARFLRLREDSFKASEELDRLLRARPVSASADFFSRHTGAYAADALNNLGIEAQRLGRPEEAVALYRRALALKPDVTEAWNNMGNAHLALNDLAAAEGDYRISRDLKPAPQVTYNLGRVYLLEGRHAAARREFERAIRDGDLREARNDLGLVFYRTGRVREAVQLWQDLLSRAPGYVTPLYNLGLAYRDLKDFKRARLAFTLYRDRVPDPEARAEVQKELDSLGGR